MGKGLTPLEQEAAIERVCVLPTISAAQLVLDELIGQINNPHRRMPIANPLRYLKTLVEQSLAHRFEPELAYRESSRRESRRRHDEALRAATAVPTQAVVSREQSRQLAGKYLEQIRAMGLTVNHETA